MKTKWYLLALMGALVGTPAIASNCDGTYIGPAPCVEDPPPVVPGPAELCLGAWGCFPVTYSTTQPYSADLGWFAQAFVSVDGYLIGAMAGPCLPSWSCPALYQQAYDTLRIEALHVVRVLRFVE